MTDSVNGAERRVMRHALGLRQGFFGRNKAYRNRYVCFEPEYLWESLCARGLAGRRDDYGSAGQVAYWVTARGWRVIARAGEDKTDDEIHFGGCQ